MPYGQSTDDKGRCNMADAKTYVYEVYTTHLDTEQMVLVQIFRDPETDKVLHAQIAFKSAVGDSWGTPYQLEKK
jgi:hypothetical protein